jgi:hypothetical protein
MYDNDSQTNQRYVITVRVQMDGGCGPLLLPANIITVETVFFAADRPRLIRTKLAVRSGHSTMQRQQGTAQAGTCGKFPMTVSGMYQHRHGRRRPGRPPTQAMRVV